ncbi:MAG: hypothetical protein M1835_003222, partial [Candelina submexicana]
VYQTRVTWSEVHNRHHNKGSPVTNARGQSAVSPTVMGDAGRGPGTGSAQPATVTVNGGDGTTTSGGPVTITAASSGGPATVTVNAGGSGGAKLNNTIQWSAGEGSGYRG